MPIAAIPDSVLKNLQAAYLDYDRQVTINNFKVACALGMILVPMTVVLDNFIYPEKTMFFLKLRLACSVLIAIFLAALLSPVGRRHYRFLGILLPQLPAFFISWMIYETEGPTSPYYAGLNLVILVIGLVLHWTFMESLAAVSTVMVMYIVASLLHGMTGSVGIFINNLWFLLLTGTIVVTGSYFHSQLRFREFCLRYELAEQKRTLEFTLEQLKETEMQLIQSEKLASLGRLSAGIIHEINNPLNYVKTSLYSLRSNGGGVAAVAEQQEILRDIEEGLERVRHIVSDLQTFARPDTDQKEPVEISSAVSAALRFLSHEWKDKVVIKNEVRPGLRILGHFNKLVQVMLNLLQNALDATQKKNQGEGEISIRSESHDGKVRLLIRDNGEGIAPENLPKIFDPFFTTKDVGEGMGMGLSICYRIVKDWNGDISAKSEPGRFSEFVLEFPEVKE